MEKEKTKKVKEQVFIIVLMGLLVGAMPGVLAFDTYINNSNIFVDGGVGIGTQTPLWMLEVLGSVNLNNSFYVNSSTGFVGIGTSSPSEKLHVAGDNTVFAIGNATTSYGGIRYNDNTSKLQFSHNNGTTWDDVGSGGVNASGGSFYGGLRWDTTPNCQWSGTTSTGGIANYSADTECDDEARTAYGLTTSNTAAGNSEGQLPQIKFNSMPSGYYRIVATGMFAATSSGDYHCAWRFATDGGLTTQFSGVNNQNEWVPSIEGLLYVPSDLGATTIQVQFSAGWSSSACEIDVNDDAVDANQDFEIDVYYFPSFGSSKNDTVFSDLDGDTRINVDGNGNDSDNITIFTNGTQRAVITSDGNVGIGTSSPTAQLSLTEDIGLIPFTPSNTSNKLYVMNNSNMLTLYYNGEQVGTGGSYNKPEMMTAYFDMRDDPTTSGSGIGGLATLRGDATYNATGEFVQLTPNTGSQSGQIYWSLSPGESLKASFDFFITSQAGADATWFFVNANDSCITGSPAESTNCGDGGYIFAFDEWENNFQLRRNGTLLANTSNATDWWADGDWHRAVITKEGPKIHVSVDGRYILAYQDVNGVEASGTNIGFGARTGSTANEHRVRRLEIISPVTPWESNWDFSSSYGVGTGYNIGIGTFDIDAKVDIEMGSNGEGRALGIRESTEDNFYIYANFTGTGTTGNWITMKDWSNHNIMTWRGDGRVGIGTTSPSHLLDVNGTISSTGLIVGAIGSEFSEIQSGNHTQSGGSAGINNFQVNFPTAFTSTPRVVATLEQGVDADIFAMTTYNVNTTGFVAKILRLDPGAYNASWGQELYINWIAWN